jgi:predicted dehydrogenase
MTTMHRVLIIGVGSIGQRHLRCFQATGRAVLSLCETNAELRRQVAEQYGVDRAYADLDAALADPPSAAVIATPAPLHIPMATKLAAAGVHLLIEKPLSTSLEGLDALQDAIGQKGLLAAVAYVWRANPVLREMKEALDSGRFGRPLHLTAHCGQHFPTYRPAYREIYYKDRALGGGAIQDCMTHLLNAGQWLAGPIDRLMADAAHLALEGVEVEDTVNVLTRQGGVLGCYSLNQHQAPNETTITVICQRGTCCFETHNNRWRWMVSPGSEWVEHQHPPLERDVMFVTQANAFLDFVEGRGRPLCTLDEAVATLRCNLAALASLNFGGWQQVSPAAEKPGPGPARR